MHPLVPVDQEVALRLMIGHELAPDPQDSEGTLALIRGFRRQFANVRPGVHC